MRIPKFNLHIQILLAILLGASFGLLIPEGRHFVGWMGVVFLKLLKLVTIPLVLTSIVNGIASVEQQKGLGRIGLKTLGFYFLTSLMAILTGLLLVNYFSPGESAGQLLGSAEAPEVASRSLSEILLGTIPDNLWKTFVDGNMLGVILIAFFLGFGISGGQGKSREWLIQFFSAFGDLVMQLTMALMKLAPVGIFAIIAKFTGDMASDSQALMAITGALGKYFLIVAGGILFHFLISLSFIIYLSSGVRPFRHLSRMTTVLMTAFSTSSSNATLPLTIRDVIARSGVSPRIAGFTLPLGATINMNGTALYECVAVMFIAQVYGIELSFGQQLIVVLTSLLAAVGSAGIPMAGLVMMGIILNAVGLPLEGIGLILAVDRPLDMLRTSLNVYGDTCGALFVARSEGEKLPH